MVRAGRRHDRFSPAKRLEDSFESLHEARDSTRADRHMCSDLDVATANPACFDFVSLMSIRILHPQQIVRQELTETPVDLFRRVDTERAALEIALVDPFLYCNVRASFKLKVALARIVA